MTAMEAAQTRIQPIISAPEPELPDIATHSYGAVGMACLVEDGASGDEKHLSPHHLRVIFALLEHAQQDFKVNGGNSTHRWSIGGLRKHLRKSTMDYQWLWGLIDDIWLSSVYWNYVNVHGVARVARQRILVSLDTEKKVKGSTEFYYKIHEDIREDVYRPSRFLVIANAVGTLDDIGYSLYRIIMLNLPQNLKVGQDWETGVFQAEALRHLLFLGGRYGSAGDFKRHVVDKSCKAITKSGDTGIDITAVPVKNPRDKRKVLGFKFLCTKTKDLKHDGGFAALLDGDSDVRFGQAQDDELYLALINRYGLTPAWVEKYVMKRDGEPKLVLEKLGRDKVTAFLEDVEARASRREINNVPSYVNKSLQQLLKQASGPTGDMFGGNDQGRKSEPKSSKEEKSAAKAEPDPAALKRERVVESYSELPQERQESLWSEFDANYSSTSGIPKSIQERAKMAQFWKWLGDHTGIE